LWRDPEVTLEFAIGYIIPIAPGLSDEASCYLSHRVVDPKKIRIATKS